MPGWTQFVELISGSLELLHSSLGSWGLAIIVFTVAIKLVTWPLTSKQLKSSKAMQELQPRVKALQEKYKDDREKQTQEMMKLYQEMGVNPVMGCLPMLIQMPIWFALYQAILNLANSGAFAAGFLFLPTLACPSADATICPATQGLGWVFNLSTLNQTWPYLILPVLTVLTQVGVSRLMSPAPTSSQANSEDPTQAMMKQMTTIMPIMFGVFALQFPAGLALYWVANNVLTFIQYWVLNRSHAPSALAPSAVLAGSDGGRVIEVEAPKPATEYAKESKDGKSRRKRKKR